MRLLVQHQIEGMGGVGMGMWWDLRGCRTRNRALLFEVVSGGNVAQEAVGSHTSIDPL